MAREFTVANAGHERLVVSAVAAPAGFVLVDVPKVPFTVAPETAITFSAILSAQAGGGASGDAVTYTPPGGFVGTDTFTYTLAAGSRTATGLVSVRVRTSDLIPSNAVYLRPMASPGTGIEMRFSGISGRSYSVQFTESIGSGWTELSRQTAQAGSGLNDFVHTTPPPGNGFYRCLPAN